MELPPEQDPKVRSEAVVAPVSKHWLVLGAEVGRVIE